MKERFCEMNKRGDQKMKEETKNLIIANVLLTVAGLALIFLIGWVGYEIGTETK